jgi:hypothetical protein
MIRVSINPDFAPFSLSGFQRRNAPLKPAPLSGARCALLTMVQDLSKSRSEGAIKPTVVIALCIQVETGGVGAVPPRRASTPAPRPNPGA